MVKNIKQNKVTNDYNTFLLMGLKLLDLAKRKRGGLNSPESVYSVPYTSQSILAMPVWVLLNSDCTSEFPEYLERLARPFCGGMKSEFLSRESRHQWILKFL